MERIVATAKKYCRKLFSESRCSSLPFHNWQHTLEVYENVRKIGNYENIGIEEMELVMLAALFHDTGNSKIFDGHENFGMTEANLFLQNWEYPVDKIALIMDCISATRIPQQPNTTVEKILCDADLFHLGCKSFHKKNKLLRKEWSKFLDLEYDETTWNQMNIKFLKQHIFHTSYGKKILEPIKQGNLKELERQLSKTVEQ